MDGLHALIDGFSTVTLLFDEFDCHIRVPTCQITCSKDDSDYIIELYYCETGGWFE